MSDTYRVVFTSTTATHPRPIATAAMSRQAAMDAFNYQTHAARFSVWGGTERMRVVDEDQYQAIRAMTERSGR
jgi:hypothetical protein